MIQNGPSKAFKDLFNRLDGHCYKSHEDWRHVPLQLEEWLRWLLWHCRHTIQNIFIYFIILINKGQESSLNILTIAPDFSKVFSCSFFRFLVCRVVVFLILGCWACVVGLDSSTCKTTYWWKSLRADPFDNTHNASGMSMSRNCYCMSTTGWICRE